MIYVAQYDYQRRGLHYFPSKINWTYKETYLIYEVLGIEQITWLRMLIDSHF